jgi:hypothetical protein
MKIGLLLLLLTAAVFAKSHDSCYTVQLVSKHNSQKNLELLNKKTYPNSCKLMSIGNSLTVRCGCYEKYVEAEDSLESFKQSYKIAVIATTYKYRFDDTVVEQHAFAKKVPASHTKIESTRDEELRLVLQVFLYKGDLNNAYKAARLGVKSHPNSYYWNQKMSEITKWTNRPKESMKYLRKMYDIHRDPKIEDELIEYGSDSFEYESIESLVVNKAKANPTEKNIDLMMFVYKKIGSPEKILGVLDSEYEQDKTNRMLLTKALALSLKMGDINRAKHYVKLLEEVKPYTNKDATLIAKYYYIIHDIQKAYDSLENVHISQKSVDNKHIKYYELKSDLGWYLQENEVAAEASKHLIDQNSSRLVDYERVAFVYQKKDPILAAEISREAYLKYKHSYLFYSYANGAIKSKNYNALADLLTSIEKENSPLLKEALFWMIKAKVYAYYKEKLREQKALTTAYELEPDNMQIKLELLWFYMDTQNAHHVKMLLDDMAESSDLSPSLYFPMASGYFSLSDINRASYYTQELLALDNPIIDTIEFKFLQAYIYQVQNNEYAFSSYMQDIVRQLKVSAKENPKLKTEDEYLSNYLRAAMNTMNPDKFEKKLKKAKPYLKKVNYDEIAYSWAIKNSAYEKSHKIYHKMHKKALWVDFSDALVSQDHSRIDNLLQLYLHSLSVGDASQAAQKDGQVALSQTITYDTLNTNEKNQNAYIHHMNLSKERSDRLDTKLSYYNREPLLQKYVKIDNRTYLQDGYYLYTKLDYFLNSATNTKVLINVPDSSLVAGLGLKRVYNRGDIEAHVNYHSSMRAYMESTLDAKYQLSTDIKIAAKAALNMNAEESTQLLIGGKKDMLATTLDWQLLNSTMVNFLYQYNSYSSQDEVNLGDGTFSRISVAQQIRNGYPDLRIGAFYDRGLYNEKHGDQGVIEELSDKTYNVLPNNFYNIGVTLSYGMANSHIYTRVWRPYFEVYPYYNSDIDTYTFGALAGYGGKVFHQDHLAIGASYTESVNGVGGSVLEIYLNYQFMYYHP